MTKTEAEGLMDLIGKHTMLKGAVKDRGSDVYQFTLTGVLTIAEPFLVYADAVRRLREAGVKIPRKNANRVRQLNRRQTQIRQLSNE